MKTNIEINTKEFWATKLNNIIFKPMENNYTLIELFEGDNKVTISIVINPVDRKKTHWEAMLSANINGTIKPGGDGLRFIKKAKKDAFKYLVEHLKVLNSRDLLAEGVKATLTKTSKTTPTQQETPKQETTMPNTASTTTNTTATHIYHKDGKGWFLGTDKETYLHLRTAIEKVYEMGHKVLIHVPMGMDGDKCRAKVKEIAESLYQLQYSVLIPSTPATRKEIVPVKLHLAYGANKEIDPKNSGWWYPGSASRPRPFKEVILEVHGKGKRPVITVPQGYKVAEFHAKMKAILKEEPNLRYTLTN